MKIRLHFWINWQTYSTNKFWYFVTSWIYSAIKKNAAYNFKSTDSPIDLITLQIITVDFCFNKSSQYTITQHL
jgi:hypothetical protein